MLNNNIVIIFVLFLTWVEMILVISFKYVTCFEAEMAEILLRYRVYPYFIDFCLNKDVIHFLKCYFST